MEIEKLIGDLERTRDKTLSFFDLPANVLHKNYGFEKWNISELLCHLADAETVLYDRIRRTIANPGQVVWGFEQGLWAEKLDYNNFPLELNKAIYKATREAIIYLAKQYYESHGHNQAVHNSTGQRSLTEFFDKVAWHNNGHIEHIEQALKM